MAGKSKAKHKPAQSPESGGATSKESSDKAREVTKRLRKATTDLKALNKQAEENVKSHPSAVTLLCHAKVQLSLVIEEILKSGILDDKNVLRTDLPREQSKQLSDAASFARKGAEEFQSLLCARFYCKLMAVIQPGFDDTDKLTLKVTEMTDPNSELVEQPPHLCEFEKLEELPRHVEDNKLNVALENEIIRKSSRRKPLGAPNAFDVSDGVYHSGLLYEIHKHNLGSALQRRQNRTKNFQHHIELVTSSSRFRQLESDVSSGNDEDGQKAVADQLRHRQQKRREEDAELRAEWFEDVVEYIQHVVDKYKDNDSRLAALQNLTCVSLTQLLHAAPQNPPKDQLPELGFERLSDSLSSLVPSEGVGTCCTVFWRDDARNIVPHAESLQWVKEGTIAKVLQTYGRDISDLQTVTIDPEQVASQLWDDTLVKWQGVVPPDMSPMSLSALHSNMESLREEDKPVCLDEPSDGILSIITAYLMGQVTASGDSIDEDDAAGLAKEAYLKMLTNRQGKQQSLQDLSSACSQDFSACACDLSPSYDWSMLELRPSPDNEWTLGLSVAEAALYSDKTDDYDKSLIMRGQIIVTLVEQLPAAETADNKMQQVYETYQRHMRLEQVAYRLESRLEGKSMSASDLRSQEEPSTANGHPDSNSDSSATQDLGDEDEQILKAHQEAWWHAAQQRFSDEQVRAAALEEIRLALTALHDQGFWTMGLSLAVSGHISKHVPRDAGDKVTLEHIRVLGVEPLRSLLNFLWAQLGLRWMHMPQPRQAMNLTLCGGKSSYEFLPDKRVRYAGSVLRHVAQDKQALVNGDGPTQAERQQSTEQPVAEVQGAHSHLSCCNCHLYSMPRCSALDKPEVDEAFIRLFVDKLFSTVPSDNPEPELEYDGEEMLPQDVPNMSQAASLRMHNMLHEAIGIVSRIGALCAQIVYGQDVMKSPERFQHNLEEEDKFEHYLRHHVDPQFLEDTRKAVHVCNALAGSRAAAFELSAFANNTAHEVKQDQMRRVMTLQSGIRGCHMENLQNMGMMTLRDVEALIRRPVLYDGILVELQRRCDRVAIQFEKECRMLKKQMDFSQHEVAQAGDDLLPENFIDRFVLSSGDGSEEAASNMLSYSHITHLKALDSAVDSITRLALHLDMLSLQIRMYSTVVVDNEHGQALDAYIHSAHSAVLRDELVQRAKTNKDETKKQVADKTMAELLKADEESKQIAEGPSKKAKKKKKASKRGGGDKQEVPILLEQQANNDIPEDWESEIPPDVEETSDLQNGVEAAAEASTRESTSPASALTSAQTEDYLRSLRDAPSEEDWSTVDKKKDRRGKAPKPAEAPAAAAPTSSSWDTPDQDDGWEKHDHIMLPDPEQTPAGPSLRADGMPSSNNHTGQPDQDPATASNSKQEDLQCDRCGKWGHKAEVCNEAFCDHCGERGHSIKTCVRFKQQQGAGRGEPEAAPMNRAADQRNFRGSCYHCGEFGHVKSECPKWKQVQVERIATTICYHCRETGHKSVDCPNRNKQQQPSARARQGPDTRDAPTGVSAQSAGPAQPAAPARPVVLVLPQAEPTKGKVKGMRSSYEGQNEPGAANTLPLVRERKRGKDSQLVQGEAAQDFPSLTKMPPGIPIPPDSEQISTASLQPPPPPPPQSKPRWGPQQEPAPAKPNSRAALPRTPGWGQDESIQEQAASGWDNEDQNEYADDEEYHSPPASLLRHSPERTVQAAWRPDSGARGNAVRSLHPPEASTSGRGHSALPQGIMQPGMGQASWASAPLPQPPPPQLQVHARMHDQLASSNDPVISPAFAARPIPAATSSRPYYPQQRQQQQQQQSYDPAAPVRQFMLEEGHVPQPAPVPVVQAAVQQASEEPFNTALFLEDLMNESRLDNRPVVQVAPEAAVSSAQWPGLGESPPAAPAALTWASRVENKDDAASEEQEEDDEELQRALQASLADSQAEQRQQAYASEVMRQSHSNAVAANGNSVMGLQNMTGEYNCFLNVIIQCLWHCHEFRRQVMKWHPRVYEDNEVVLALIGLFRAFAEKEQSIGLTEPVDPTQLRVALGKLEMGKFAVGQMGDAAEVLNALYDKLADVAARAGQPELLEESFGLHVREHVHCDQCQLDTHQHEYTQYFFNVMSTSIVLQKVCSGGTTLGELLADIEGQSHKSCDTDKGGCNEQRAVKHHLVNCPPHVFTLQLAWQSSNEAGDDIKNAMQSITEELDLGEVYLQVPRRKHIYHIRSMVCYYGQHYLAFVLMPNRCWCVFDDAAMQSVGSWANVINKCAKGRTQASVLFFEHM